METIGKVQLHKTFNPKPALGPRRGVLAGARGADLPFLHVEVPSSAPVSLRYEQRFHDRYDRFCKQGFGVA